MSRHAAQARRRRALRRRIAAPSTPKESAIGRVILKHGGNAFLLYMAPAVLFIVWLDTEFNAPFDLAFKYLLPPTTLIAYVVTFLWCGSWVRKKSIITVATWPGLVAVLLVLIAGPYIAFLNTVVGEQRLEIVQGHVVETTSHSGRSRSHSLKLRQPDGQLVQLRISEDEYERINVGDTYTREMTRGGFGLLYRKRF